MGTWAAGPLDNDSALDFVDGLLDQPPDDAVNRLLKAVEAAAGADSGRLDYSRAASALAAVAVLVDASLPQRLKAWRATLPVKLTPALAEVMREAIERAQSVDSELADLWAEAGKSGEFAGGLAHVVAAVAAVGVDPAQPSLF